MMRRTRNLSFRGKMLLFAVVTAGTALTVCLLVVAVGDWLEWRGTIAMQANRQAMLIAENVKAAVSFKDSKAAEETVATLSTDPSVVHAAVLDADGQVLARYVRAGADGLVDGSPIVENGEFANGFVRYIEPITLNGTRIGAVVLQYDLLEFRREIARLAATMCTGALLALWAAYWVSALATRVLTRPILSLSETAAQIAQSEDYSVRATKSTNDEVGRLTDTFNDMLARIQERDESLAAARDGLEKRVTERTVDLAATNAQLADEIADRKRAEEALRESEEKFRSISASAQDAIIMMDNSGDISYWNKAAETIFGYTREEVIGRHLHSAGLIVPERFIEAHDRVWPEFQETGQGSLVGKTREIVGLRKNGEEFPIELSLSAVTLKGRWHAIAILRDITERKRAEEERERFGRVLEDSLNEIYVFDAETLRFLEVNRGACENLGYSQEELHHLTPLDLKPEFTAESFAELVRPLRDGDRKKVEFTTVHRRKDGSRYPVEVHLQLSHGVTPVFLAFIIDITERKSMEVSLRKTETELRQHRDHLEELVEDRTAELARINASLVHEIEERKEAEKAAAAASSAKGEFLATMSHELRTPLNGVIGMTELLLGTELDSTQRRFASLAKASGDALLALINDVLDLSKIEAGKLELEHVGFDLRAAVENVAMLLAPTAGDKNVELLCKIHPSVPTAVLGDPGRLQQVLRNLVGNALKFTQDGEVLIRVSTDDQTGGEAMVRFSVTDTGVGIAADRIDHIFDSFTQADSSTTRKYGGTGLGLAISKQLVQMMGGEIGVSSTEGRGSTFWFVVKFTMGTEQGIMSQSFSRDLRYLRVLAVDDNATNREILHEQLTGFGFVHRTVSDGAGALRMLRKAAEEDEPYGLAILDMQMPGMDGEQLACAIRSDPLLRDTPLLLLTSLGPFEDPQRVKRAGFNNWIAKPVMQSQLLDAIVETVACAEAPSSEDLEVLNATSARDAIKASARKSAARILLAEDNDIGREVAEVTLKQAGHVVDAVANGREAVDAFLSGAYDLILMDCQMPEMDGFEATRRIREHESKGASQATTTGRIPIIALTANALKGDRERCLEAGMDDYVSKPLDPKRLVDTIESQLAARGKGKSATDRTADTTADDSSSPPATGEARVADEPPPFDVATLLKRWGGNQKLIESMITKFRARVEDDFRKIEACVAADDADGTTASAHALKGAAAYLEARQVRELSARLEQMGRANDLSGAEACLEALRTEVGRCVEGAGAVMAAVGAQSEG